MLTVLSVFRPPAVKAGHGAPRLCRVPLPNKVNRRARRTPAGFAAAAFTTTSPA
jgi:hypothetical protein